MIGCQLTGAGVKVIPYCTSSGFEANSRESVGYQIFPGLAVISLT